MTPEVRILNQDAAGDLFRLRRSALLSSMIISSRSCVPVLVKECASSSITGIPSPL